MNATVFKTTLSKDLRTFQPLDKMIHSDANFWTLLVDNAIKRRPGVDTIRDIDFWLFVARFGPLQKCLVHAKTLVFQESANGVQLQHWFHGNQYFAESRDFNREFSNQRKFLVCPVRVQPYSVPSSCEHKGREGSS